MVSVWDIVRKSNWRWCQVEETYSSGRIRVKWDHYTLDRDEYQEVKSRKKKIWKLMCNVAYDWEDVKVYFKDWSFETSYFWDIDEFIKANQTMIQSYFFSKIDILVNQIMNRFTENFDRTLSELKWVVLPATKDLLLTKVVEEFKNNTIKVANLFEEVSVKNTLLNIFK